MTEFKQLELIYDQFASLTNQINQLIADENYEEATLRLVDKDKLIKKMFLTRKTINFTDEEQKKIELIDKQISVENQKLIESLEKDHRELAEKLNSTKKQVKMNSAYEIRTEEKIGDLVDTSE